MKYIYICKEQNSLQWRFLISHRNFSPIKMHRFLIFYIKSGANIEKSRNIGYNYINSEVAFKGVEHVE